MACVVAPMVEAIVITVVKKAVEKKEKKTESEGSTSQLKISWSRKLSWLNNMLWGGVLLLVIEHIWHGEIVPWWPFLTAMNNPADIGPMLREILVNGTIMSLLVTLVWGIMVVIAEHKSKAVSVKMISRT